MPFTRVLFLGPGMGPMRIHMGLFNGALTLDIKTFCQEMAEAVEGWLDAVEDTERFRQNYEAFLHLHPEGISPHIEGCPVIG